MQTALISLNFAVKIAAAVVFAHDGDMTAAAVFAVMAPLSSWLWTR